MDLITTSLQQYLKTVKLGFYTKYENTAKTLTRIETAINGADISASILIEINSDTNTINGWVLPLMVVDCKKMPNIEKIRGRWEEKQRVAKLILNEEGISDKRKCFSIQLCVNILSDASGLSRTLWHKYFECIYKETTQLCRTIYSLKDETNDIKILSI